MGFVTDIMSILIGYASRVTNPVATVKGRAKDRISSLISVPVSLHFSFWMFFMYQMFENNEIEHCESLTPLF